MRDDDKTSAGPNRRRAIKTTAGLAAATAFIGRGLVALPALTVAAKADHSSGNEIDHDDAPPPRVNPVGRLDSSSASAMHELLGADGMVVTVKVHKDFVQLIEANGTVLVAILPPA